MNMILKDVTAENWEECIGLLVTEEQEDLVAPNWYSLLESKYYEDMHPMAIYDGKTMVGFLMYDKDPDSERWQMSSLMIDEKFQRKGFGLAAVKKLITVLRIKLGHIEFYTSIQPENEEAIELCEKAGFQSTGAIEFEHEIFMIKL